MDRELTCEQRVESHRDSRIADLRELFGRYCQAESDGDIEDFNNYGLSFDYVPRDDDGGGYFRYQISWGGPSDEFRFFVDIEHKCYRVEYWFMDLFDGACRELDGDDLSLMLLIFQDFKELGVIDNELQKALEA